MTKILGLALLFHICDCLLCWRLMEQCEWRNDKTAAWMRFFVHGYQISKLEFIFSLIETEFHFKSFLVSYRGTSNSFPAEKILFLKKKKLPCYTLTYKLLFIWFILSYNFHLSLSYKVDLYLLLVKRQTIDNKDSARENRNIKVCSSHLIYVRHVNYIFLLFNSWMKTVLMFL